MTNKLLHTPDGVRDLYNGEYKKKLELQDNLHQVFMDYGCLDIQTPTFEYFDVFSSKVGTTPTEELFKFFDNAGNTVVLRPDFTPAVARCAAKYFAPEKEAVKLSYMGNTFTNSPDYQGKLKETTQCGVEFIGDGSVEADSEMLAMVVDALKSIGMEEFRISVGYAEWTNESPDMPQAINRISTIEKQLEAKGIREYFSFEKGIVGNYDYYTGIIFAGYTYGHGDPIVKGGRYDKLLSNFGKEAPAIGFAFVVDQLLEALRTDTSNSKEYLTFALGKGRLAKKTLSLMEQIGIHCDEIYDPDTRKLIFVNEELKLRFFLAKGPDVPTYVEHGAADIGVVGKDTILEEGRSVYEVLDLGFGSCRMCICGPESAKALLDSREQIRVATKYPQIAKDYFYNEKHQTVELIKLNGSIELAPIVGLSDVICDIVETGSTLRENGLVVLEEVCPLSARMIVNQVSMKMQNERITKLINSLQEIL